VQQLQLAGAGAAAGGSALQRAEAWLPVCLSQEKLATKVRKKEITIRNLTTECERIRAKQALDELTAGQASTLARNERSIDILKEEVRKGWSPGAQGRFKASPATLADGFQATEATELLGRRTTCATVLITCRHIPDGTWWCAPQMDDLEETLNDSVRDSVLGRKKASAEATAAKKAAAERRRRQREEDQDAGRLPVCSPVLCALCGYCEFTWIVSSCRTYKVVKHWASVSGPPCPAMTACRPEECLLHWHLGISWD
jgi:hypothetical protein